MLVQSISVQVLGLHCSPAGGLVQPYDGLEPGNRLRRLGLWGAIYAGPFPLGLVLVLYCIVFQEVAHRFKY